MLSAALEEDTTITKKPASQKSLSQLLSKGVWLVGLSVSHTFVNFVVGSTKENVRRRLRLRRRASS